MVVVGDLVAFIGVVAVIVVLPGPDMALVLQNGLARGRRAAVETALGINAGLLVWAIAAALGIAALLHASAPAFTLLKLAGGVLRNTRRVRLRVASHHPLKDLSALAAARLAAAGP